MEIKYENGKVLTKTIENIGCGNMFRFLDTPRDIYMRCDRVTDGTNSIVITNLATGTTGRCSPNKTVEPLSGFITIT